jgi:acetyl esterase/lipase
VLAVEYSGSGDDQFVQRLRRWKLEALGCDAIVLAHLISQYKRDHPDVRILLHGESFSGLPTLEAASVALRDNDAVVLFSPWTHYRMSTAMAQDRTTLSLQDPFADRDKTLEAYRRNNADLLGIDEEEQNDVGRAWMEAARSSIHVRAPTLVFFGQYENRVDLTEVRSWFASKLPQSFVVVLDGNFHETTPSDPKAAELIRERLEEAR